MTDSTINPQGAAILAFLLLLFIIVMIQLKRELLHEAPQECVCDFENNCPAHGCMLPDEL